MKYVSSFSGIGGLDKGLDEAGMSCVAQIEIDANCQRILHHHWPTVPKFTDITEVSGAQLPSFDLLCGGFPCQDISKAKHGGRDGLAGARSGLFFEFARLLDECQPAWFILENVPHLLRTDGGRDMGALIGTLVDLGYGIAWRVLDSVGFGVPQRRRRILIVGRAGGDGERAGAVLLEGVDSGEDPRADLPRERPARPAVGENPADHLRRLIFRKSRRPQSTKDFETWVPDTIANTLTTWDVGEVRSTQLIIEGDRARRLTPTEWERCQGFPDGWTDVPGVPESARFHALGNAVTVPEAAWIGRRIMEAT